MTVRQDLIAGNSRIGSALVNNTGQVARTAFENLGSWRDSDVDRYIKLLSPTLNGAKRQGAKSSVAFYRAMANLDNQAWTAPAITGADLTTQALRNGVTTSQVYRRPFVDVYTALSQGKDMSQAIELGASRAESLASTEVQLARRNAGLKARNSNDRIVGYIRTLTGAENCALCYVASTQRYTRGELMPIHPGCDCGEMPIYGNQDPGQVIDEARLEATHDSIAQRFGSSDRSGRDIDYRSIKIQQNGELGPVLTIRGQGFTGPSKIPGPRLPNGNFYLDDSLEVDYGREALGLAQDIDIKARAAEPSITKSMIDIGDANGTELSGLKFRRKEKASLARKIVKDAEEKGITLTQSADKIGDSVRYTMVADEATYRQKATQVLSDLKAQGYEILQEKNYWRRGNGYMGVNTNLLSPDGYKLELQFHTPSSLAVKQPSHDLYEASRKLPDGPEKDALVKKSRELWSTVVLPDDIDGFGKVTIQ